MLASTRAFVELRNAKIIVANCNEENRRLRIAIFSLQKSNKELESSNEDLSLSLKKQEIISFNNKVLSEEFENSLKKEKYKKIGLSVTLPVAIIGSFLAGWYLHSAVK